MSKTRSGGISFAGALAILFIGLKLCNIIDWSWLWVLSPLWLGAAVFIAVILMGIAGVFLIAIFNELINKLK